MNDEDGGPEGSGERIHALTMELLRKPSFAEFWVWWLSQIRSDSKLEMVHLWEGNPP